MLFSLTPTYISFTRLPHFFLLSMFNDKVERTEELPSTYWPCYLEPNTHVCARTFSCGREANCTKLSSKLRWVPSCVAANEVSTPATFFPTLFPALMREKHSVFKSVLVGKDKKVVSIPLHRRRLLEWEWLWELSSLLVRLDCTKFPRVVGWDVHPGPSRHTFAINGDFTATIYLRASSNNCSPFKQQWINVQEKKKRNESS